MTPPPNTGSALRRVLLAGLAYGVLLVVFIFPLAGAMRRAFLLPPSFDPMARGLFAFIGVVVLLAAWRYPEMGVGPGDGPAGPGEDGRDDPRRGPRG